MRRISVVLVGLVMSMPLWSQTVRERIEKDRSLVGCNLHIYELPDRVSETKAPKGYEPFYVSHFSRHGSRYMSQEKEYRCVGVLEDMSRNGLLTEAGEALYQDIRRVADAHRGMVGFLTKYGAGEIRGIAERLYSRCPQIFSDRKRKEVLAVSSTSVRCNQSMANFCLELQSRSCNLNFELQTGGRTDTTVVKVAKGSGIRPGKSNGKAEVDSLTRISMDVQGMLSRFFLDAEAAVRMMPGQSPAKFFFNVLRVGSIVQCMDEDLPDVYAHFTNDELYGFWIANNAYTYNICGASHETNGTYRRRGYYALKDLVAKADEAISDGSSKAADVRFTHDTHLLPLLQFMGLEGIEKVCRVGKETEAGWYAFDEICMGTNLQVLFYKNRSGDILVKFLHNERERHLPTVEPFSGPYYRWDTVRNCFLDQMSAYVKNQ